MFTKILCSLPTETDKRALKYLPKYTDLNSFFDRITKPQFSSIAWLGLLVWL